MDRDEFWRSDDDEAVLAEYLAEHAYLGSVFPDGGGFLIGFGDPDRVPPLPRTSPCAFCGTEVREHGDAGWRHEVGLKARGGCTMPCPVP